MVGITTVSSTSVNMIVDSQMQVHVVVGVQSFTACLY